MPFLPTRRLPPWLRLAAAPVPERFLAWLAGHHPAAAVAVAGNPACPSDRAEGLAGTAHGSWWRPTVAAFLLSPHAGGRRLAAAVAADTEPRLAAAALANPALPAPVADHALQRTRSPQLLGALLANPALDRHTADAALQRAAAVAGSSQVSPTLRIGMVRLLARHPSLAPAVAGCGAAGIAAVAEHPGGLGVLKPRQVAGNVVADRVARLARRTGQTHDPLLVAAQTARAGRDVTAPELMTVREDVSVAAAAARGQPDDAFVLPVTPSGYVAAGYADLPLQRRRLAVVAGWTDTAHLGTGNRAQGQARQVVRFLPLPQLAAKVAPLETAGAWETFCQLLDDWDGPLDELVDAATTLGACRPGRT